MATTDSRPGFRLPWSTEHRPATDELATAGAATEEAPPDGEIEQTVATTPEPSTDLVAADPVEPQIHEGEAPVAPIASRPEPATTLERGDRTPAASAAPNAPKRPTKFLADLTRAMQVAAQSERDETLRQYQADAKAFVDQLEADSAVRVADYRTSADDDVAAIKEWSKAEVTRIRDETDRRIADRKTDLDEQLERYAARIERETERVQSLVGAYEDEMARFFERLLAVDDPTMFAAIAASMPEPPSFAADLDGVERGPVAAKAVVTPDPINLEVVQAPAEIEPAATPVTESEPMTGEPAIDAADLRIAALGLTPDFAPLGRTPDFAAAEAEAAVDAATASGDGSDEGSEEDGSIPTVDDDALAARLAGLVPTISEPSESVAPTPSPTMVTTQVVVVGLVSVASIASFKRHLARVPGVQSVGVASGPDGEFVFGTVHNDDVALREIVPTIPGFQARVSSAGEGIVHVTAHDPESES